MAELTFKYSMKMKRYESLFVTPVYNNLLNLPKFICVKVTKEQSCYGRRGWEIWLWEDDGTNGRYKPTTWTQWTYGETAKDSMEEFNRLLGDRTSEEIQELTTWSYLMTI